MTALVRYRYSPLSDVQSSFDRMLEPFFSRFNPSGEEFASGTWIPPVDVAEENDQLIFHAEIPGVLREDLDIQFIDGALVIRGERKLPSQASNRNYHRVERTFGKFTRSFVLPRTADTEKINATFRDGILEVVIPKRVDAKPRQIRINE